LFLDVCHAVQHAHQKGIIHRDLKPSNVLVEVHDVQPVVKVIDFGIAKAMGQQLTDKTVYTAVLQMVGTPLYMSPEQAGLSSLDVDTRSDVYSLGVLLYELLTGATPFDREQFKNASYDEMRRIVREEEPPRPSTRLSTIEQAELSTIAERRGLEPRRLSQQVRGELDWIVMKALEKDRNRRYESSSAFAADVQRYLEDEPVQACPPSTTYRLRKFVRRHKQGLGVAAGLLVVLVLGVLALWRDLEQRAAAAASVEAALERADELREQERWQEAASVLAVAQGQLEGRRLGALRQRVELLQRDLKMAATLESIRLQQAEVRDGRYDEESAAPAYAAAFDDYNLPVLELEPEEAAPRLAASAIGEQLLAALVEWSNFHPDPVEKKKIGTLLRLADRNAWRQQVWYALDDQDGAKLEQLARSAEALDQPPSRQEALGYILARFNKPAAIQFLRQAQQRRPDDFWINHQLAYHLVNLKPPQPEEAIGFYRAALAVRPYSAGVHLNLGHALRVKGQFDEAIAECREAVRLNKDFAEAHNNLGAYLMLKGQLDEAIAEYREAIRLKKDFAHAHHNLGNALGDKGQLDDAIASYHEAIRLQKDYADTHNNLGNALRDKGHLDEAIAEFREAIRLQKDDAGAHNNLGNALDDKGQFDEAIAEYREAIRIKKDFAEYHCNLGSILRRNFQLDEAIAEYREAIRIKKDYADAHHNLGAILHQIGQFDEAIAEFREAIRINKDNAYAHYALGILLCEQMGQFNEALIYLRRGHELGSKNPRWIYSSAQTVRSCERYLELDGKLPAILSGQKQPADPAERIGVARLCTLWCKKRYADAVRFFREALEEEPRLADDLDAQHRYNAACAATQAGCGQGTDVDALDAQERARLRQQALDWLRADLKAYHQLMEKSAGKAGPTITQRMRHWLQDTDFAVVRGAEALSKLPEAERQSWQQLWAEVADTLEKSRGKSTVKEKPDTKKGRHWRVCKVGRRRRIGIAHDEP
jgi:tetratricopeptide (TPR) repeat protein